MERYVPVKQLGDGAYGSVVLATETDTGEKVAIKKWALIFIWVGHRRTQDFTMDRVHVVGAGRGDLGDGSAQLDPGTKAKCKN